MSDTPPLRIEPARPEDVPEVLRLIRDLAVYEKLEHKVVATEEGLRETLFGERPAAEVLFARVGTQTAGFALFFHNYSTFLGQRGLYLEDLYVRPEYRGHGCGKALLARLAALAVERRCGRLEWAVLDWNAPAIGFYERLGAEPMSDWTVFRLTGEPLRRLASVGAEGRPKRRSGSRSLHGRWPMETHGYSERAGLVSRVALVALLVAAALALCGVRVLSACGILG